MCGIFCILGSECGEAHASFIRGAARGPDHSVAERLNKDVLFGFHRLAINGFGKTSANQPMRIDGCALICNGEIYNWRRLHAQMGEVNVTSSDCEIIVRMYRRYGIRETLLNLDGVFAFVLYDERIDTVYVGRDLFGVRPLFQCRLDPNDDDGGGRGMPGMGFASELKMLSHLQGQRDLVQFPPGTFAEICNNGEVIHGRYAAVRALPTPMVRGQALERVRSALVAAVRKRVANTDREVACLLSGGLDSSLVAAIVAAEIHPRRLHTYSIGMPGSPDTAFAQIAADHIGTIHHRVECTRYDFLEVVPDVIRAIESYDVTTVRASVGHWLVARHIRQHSDAKVILGGDGADECCGGYLYMHAAPSDLAFDVECRRLLENIHLFDLLRADRCLAAHGLEARVPFLDASFVQEYLGVPCAWRRPAPLEKQLLRDAFRGSELLPESILDRKKEAFSDGVSHQSASWFEVLQSHIASSRLASSEKAYYAAIFEECFPGCAAAVPRSWMPRFVHAVDPSARTLGLYGTATTGRVGVGMGVGQA